MAFAAASIRWRLRNVAERVIVFAGSSSSLAVVVVGQDTSWAAVAVEAPAEHKV